MSDSSIYQVCKINIGELILQQPLIYIINPATMKLFYVLKIYIFLTLSQSVKSGKIFIYCEIQSADLKIITNFGL